MTDILREVDEAVRADKFKRLWDEHGIALIVGAVALVIGTAAHSGWNAWSMHQKKEHTSALLTALEQPKPIEAMTTLTADGVGGSEVITLMTGAAKALEAKDYPAALKFYDQVIASKGAPDLYRDLAIVQKTNLLLDTKADAAAADLLKMIDQVANNASSTWQGQALLTRALVKMHKADDSKGAIADLQLLTSKTDILDSLRQRAQALLDVYQLKGKAS